MTDPTPRIRYTGNLQEAVVDRLLRQRLEAGDRSTYERYRQAADRIYILHERPETRLEAFRVLHARLFEEMGSGALVADAVERFTGRIGEVFVSRAWTRAEEGAELSADRRTLGLRVLPNRFASPSDLGCLLDHECERVADILDETFGYGTGLPDGPAGATRALGERFGFLWDCSLDGRTARAGGTPLRTREERQEECARLFFRLSPDAAEAVVRRLWEGERPAYAALVQMAANPAALAAWAGIAPDADGASSDPLPGTPCPLCDFPTHAWAPTIDATLASLIGAEFPSWQRSRGACARCVEGYQVRI
jgi:hypothetical protein